MIKDLIGWFVSGRLNISKKKIFGPIESGGLGLPRAKLVLEAQQARLWTLAEDRDDLWRDKYITAAGGLMGWGQIDENGCSMTMRLLLSAWSQFRTAYAASSRYFLSTPIGLGFKVDSMG